jgi:hypothetical protein
MNVQRKSRNILVLAFATLALCCSVVALLSLTPKSSPTDVAKQWLTASTNMDWEAAKKISTKECAEFIDFQKMFTDELPPERIAEIKNLKWAIVGEAAIKEDIAEVTYTQSETAGTLTLPLLKVNGNWLVNLTKQTMMDSEIDAAPTQNEPSVVDSAMVATPAKQQSTPKKMPTNTKHP